MIYNSIRSWSSDLLNPIANDRKTNSLIRRKAATIVLRHIHAPFYPNVVNGHFKAFLNHFSGGTQGQRCLPNIVLQNVA